MALAEKQSKRVSIMTASLIIIGAGASGLMAAVTAGRLLAADHSEGIVHQDPSVLLLERMHHPGKKLLATGNGRCNFSNRKMSPAYFHSDTPELITDILDSFPAEETIRFFEDLGICVKSRNGYLYPMSGQAKSVLDVLLMEIAHLPVRLITDCEIQKITRSQNSYLLTASDGHTFQAQKVILASGGCACEKLGSNGTGYQLARQAGLHIRGPVPALTGLYTQDRCFQQVSGIRADAQLTLLVEENGYFQSAACDRGEVQLTDYGVSGIPAFQISSCASWALYEQKKVRLIIDFLPDTDLKQLTAILRKRAQRHPHKSARQLLVGMFAEKLCALFVKKAGIAADKAGACLQTADFARLADVIKNLQTQICATGDFSHAQVSAGGVSGRDLTKTLQARSCPGLYITGELADVDGLCGGYNLQWAWSSGHVAATDACRSLSVDGAHDTLHPVQKGRPDSSHQSESTHGAGTDKKKRITHKQEKKL